MAQKRILILTGIVLLLVVAGLLFFLPGEEISFEQGLAELKQPWEQKGIDITELESAAEKITNLSVADLSAIKQKLEVSKNKFSSTTSSDKQALVDLATIYINLADLTAKSRAVEALENQISSTGLFAGCDYLDLFSQRNELQKEQFELIKSFFARTESFTQKYQQQNELAGIHKPEYSLNELEDYTQTMQNSFLELKKLCEEETQ